VGVADRAVLLADLRAEGDALDAAVAEGSRVAPMPGTVVAVHVAAGAVLAVLETEGDP
jgi:hypothetical protein